MAPIQLEFNIIDENEDDVKISFLQKQIDKLNESMGKIRKKLFSQVTQLERLCFELKLENQELRKVIQCKQHEIIKWEYGQGEHLFSMKQH